MKFFRTAEIEVKDVDPDVFEAFLYYLYSGRVDCHTSDGRVAHYMWVLELLKAADRFGQLQLFGECKRILLSILTSENAADITFNG